MRPIALCAATVLMVAGQGCASSGMPTPNDPSLAAQADIARAQGSGAEDSPEGKLYLRLAREDLQKAKALMGHDNARATTLVEVSRSESRLAMSIAKTTTAQQEARRASAELEKAQQEPAGSQGSQGGTP